jgi:hypothetical protein
MFTKLRLASISASIVSQADSIYGILVSVACVGILLAGFVQVTPA